MASKQFRRHLRLAAALLAGALAAGTVQAQAPAFSGGHREDPASALNRHLKDLADNPRGLTSLVGAARAALELGDAQAAVTFYARAEEIAPRDGRIKAGIGAAFLAMEQPASALRFLEEARGLGVPDGEIAADRGLAHDLLGDPAAAQRDYQIAMRANDSAELRRRLALSRAISGDRNGALAAIQDQLSRQDRAAWRVRAFVLALTGDAAGATDAARAVMPSQAAAMQPFFSRLPTLAAADRAMAVHFGHFPGDAPSPTYEPPQSYASLSPNVTAAGRPDAAQGFAGTASRPSASSLNDAQLANRPDRSFSQPSRPTQAVPSAPQPSLPAPAQSTLASDRQQPRPVQSAQVPPASPQSRPVQLSPARSSNSAPSRPLQQMRQARGLPELDRSEGPGRRGGVRPRDTVPANVSAEAKGRPAEVSRTRTQIAANSATPPAPAFQTLAPPVSTGPVQGPPDGNALPVAVATPRVVTPAPNSVVAASTQAPAVTTPSVAATPEPAPAMPAGTTASSLGASAAATLAPMQGISGPVPPSGSSGISPLPAPPVAPPPAAAVPSSGLSAIAATIQSLEPEPVEAPKPAPAKTKPKTAEPAKADSARADTRKADMAKQPSRHWVQVAGTADKPALGREFARIRAKAPKLLAGKTGWTTPLRYTNRLLVGPFKSKDEAQDFVNELAKADLTAFTWTSPEGQEIVKLAAK